MKETFQYNTSWQEQYERMLRWYDKVEKLNDNISPEERRDILYACFQNIYYLKDWLLHSLEGHPQQSSVKQQLHTAFKTGPDEKLKLCRHLCNGSKHLKLYGKQKDKTIVMLTEGREDLKEIARYGVEWWKKFIND